MLVTCPECATRYEVDDSAFSAGGRAVRCNHCGCEWYQIGPAAPTSGVASNPALEAAVDQAAAELTSRAPIDASEKAPPPPPADDFDYFRRRPEDRGGDAARGAPQVGRRGAALAVRTDPTAFGAQLEAAAAQLPAIVDDPAEHHERRPAREARPSKTSGRLKAVAAVAVLAAAAVAGAQLLPTDSDAPEGGVTALSADEGAGGAGAATSSDVSGVTDVGSIALADLPPGVVFVESQFDLQDLPEGPALLMWGVVANNSGERVPAPVIEVITRNAAGEELERLYISPEVDYLDANATARFAGRVVYPEGPVDAVDFYIVNQ